MTLGSRPKSPAWLPSSPGAKEGQGSKPLASASERFTSYDVDAFEVPGGREENWRFTPMRRLRGLHDGTATFDGTADDRRSTAPTASPSRPSAATTRGIGEGGVPADRVAAAAWSRVPRGHRRHAATARPSRSRSR